MVRSATAAGGGGEIEKKNVGVWCGGRLVLAVDGVAAWRSTGAVAATGHIVAVWLWSAGAAAFGVSCEAVGALFVAASGMTRAVAD